MLACVGEYLNVDICMYIKRSEKHITYGTLWERARQPAIPTSHGGWSKLLQQYILNLSLNHCLKVLLPEYIYIWTKEGARAYAHAQTRRVIYALRFDDEGRSDVYVYVILCSPVR